MPAENAVQAPVNEHAEARFVPPLHAANAVGILCFGRSLWLRRWDRRFSKCGRVTGSSSERGERSARAQQPIAPQYTI
jgi:hypothetical protein